MLRKALFAVALITSGLMFGDTARADVLVRGHYRSNGTYVQPHYRSNPDGNFSNNWTTYPNINPYTGRAGTRTTPTNNYGYDKYTPYLRSW